MRGGRIRYKILFLILVILLTTSCSKLTEKDKKIIARSDESTEKGLVYLSQNYYNYQYNDGYLLFVYPGEELDCPFPDCNITYRLLDAYFDVHFLEEVMPASELRRIQNQIDDKNKIFDHLAKKWETEKIYNTIKSDDTGEGIALDTYCILGYVQDNKKMAEVVLSYLNIDDDWIPYDYYKQDIWRNIADETWCARLFIKTRIDKDKATRTTRKLLLETEAFTDSNATDIDKLSVVYHTLYMLADYEKYYDNTFSHEKVYYADFVSYYPNKNLVDDNLMLANLLDVLVYAEFDNPGILNHVADTLIKSQESAGHWRMRADFPDDAVQIFTTFRALIGLNIYKEKLENE